MKPKLLLRIASVVMLLHAAGHHATNPVAIFLVILSVCEYIYFFPFAALLSLKTCPKSIIKSPTTLFFENGPAIPDVCPVNVRCNIAQVLNLKLIACKLLKTNSELQPCSK